MQELAFWLVLKCYVLGPFDDHCWNLQIPPIATAEELIISGVPTNLFIIRKNIQTLMNYKHISECMYMYSVSPLEVVSCWIQSNSTVPCFLAFVPPNPRYLSWAWKYLAVMKEKFCKYLMCW